MTIKDNRKGLISNFFSKLIECRQVAILGKDTKYLGTTVLMHALCIIMRLPDSSNEPNTIVCGTSDETHDFRAAANVNTRLSSIYIGNTLPSTTTDNIRNHLQTVGTRRRGI